MPRKGKVTVKGTSLDKLFDDLIHLFIEEKKREFAMRHIKLSKAKVMEISVQKFLEIQGVLEPYLKKLGFSDSEIRNIKDTLKLVR